MMKRLFMVLSFLLGAFIVNASEKKDQVTVLQLNIWQNATQVEGAFDAIVNEVVAHQPDVITLCEVRNYDGIDFTKRLCDALKDNGVIYYSFKCADGGIVSKYPIEENISADGINNITNSQESDICLNNSLNISRL